MNPEGDAVRDQVRGSTLLLLGRIVAAGINLSVQVLIVRSLSRQGYGAFAYALTVAGIGEVVAMFGMRRGVARFVPIFDEAAEHGKVAGTLVMTTAIVAVVGLLFVSVVTVFRTSIAGQLAAQTDAVTVLVVLAFLAPIMAAETILDAVFAVFTGPVAIFLRQYLLVPGLRLAAVVVVLMQGSGPVALAVGYVIGGAAGIAIAGMGLLRILHRDGHLATWRGARLTIPFAQVLAFTLPLLTQDVTYILIEAADALMLAHLADAEELATLRAVLPVARANKYVILSFGVLFTPLAARLFARGARSELSHLYWRTALWSAVLAFPVLATALVLSGPVTVLLFGERYATSAPVLAILGVGFYLTAVVGPNSNVLEVHHRVGDLVTSNVVAVVTNVGLNFVLIPRLGAIGAAVATAATFAVHDGVKQFALVRRTDLEPVDRSGRRVYTVIAVASLVCAAAAGLQVPPPIGLPIVVVASGGVLVAARNDLDLGDTFPELARVPGLRWLIRS